MNASTFVAKLKRGAMASSLVAGYLVPDTHSAGFIPPVVPREAEAVITDQASLAEEQSHTEEQGLIVLNLPEEVRDWTPTMEREFRHLALREATAAVTGKDLSRLEELGRLRERLEQPRTADEVLLQLKHDRLLEKIADTLREYVEFHEGESKKRPAAG